MHLSHITSPHRQRALRQLAVFLFPLRPAQGDARYGQRGGLLALRQPHMARHTRVPSSSARANPLPRVRALYVRIHTFYLKFLQGHT
jgi:hypothetical protein